MDLMNLDCCIRKKKKKRQADCFFLLFLSAQSSRSPLNRQRMLVIPLLPRTQSQSALEFLASRIFLKF